MNIVSDSENGSHGSVMPNLSTDLPQLDPFVSFPWFPAYRSQQFAVHPSASSSIIANFAMKYP